MKWLVFIGAILASFPLGHWLRGRPALRLHAWTLVGFLPFYDALDMALLAFGMRAGDTNGLEVAAIDFFVLTLLVAQKGPSRPLPFRLSMGAYLLVAALSVTQAQWALGAFGYVWKTCRMYVLFAAICRAGDDLRVPRALLRGMMLGIVYQCVHAAWQHYGLGIHRATGTLAHANTLGMLVNLAVMVPLALLFSGRATFLSVLATIAALPSALLTVSRGTLYLLGAGSVLVYLLSAFGRYTPRKAWIGLAGLALAAVAVPFALATLASRTPGELAGSNELRWKYEGAASMMLEEHPLGIGPNHFTTLLLTGGYGARAGVEWSQRVAIVHNVYWLTAAEMGYAGVLALVVLFLVPLASAIRYGLRARRDHRGDILLGLGVALAMVYTHSLVEWAWRATPVQYAYWMAVGVVASLSRQVRDRLPIRLAVPASPWAPGVRLARASRRSEAPAGASAVASRGFRCGHVMPMVRP